MPQATISKLEELQTFSHDFNFAGSHYWLRLQKEFTHWEMNLDLDFNFQLRVTLG